MIRPRNVVLVIMIVLMLAGLVRHHKYRPVTYSMLPVASPIIEPEKP